MFLAFMRHILVRQFRRERYLREMMDLVTAGCRRLRSERPGVRVYTVSIWTDPDAAVSAINFDTLENSRAQVEAAKAYQVEMVEELLRGGDTELAELMGRPIGSRNVDPADFELRTFRLTEHWSVPHRWEERSGGACWAELEPALDEVVRRAMPVLAKLDLEEGAILGVNGRKDWFERTWPIGQVRDPAR